MVDCQTWPAGEVGSSIWAPGIRGMVASSVTGAIVVMWVCLQEVLIFHARAWSNWAAFGGWIGIGIWEYECFACSLLVRHELSILLISSCPSMPASNVH